MTAFPRAVEAAMARMRTAFPASPLQRNAYLSQRYGAEIYLKREDLTEVRSYKIRGACNVFSKALEEVTPPTDFVCASAGNHAQGFAWCCARMGVRGVIFMPSTTPQQKVDKTAAFGGQAVEIRLTGDFFDECLAAARDYTAESGARFVPPFDAPDIIEGQATVTLEIVEALGRAPDMLILPVGGGGLSAGATRLLAECDAPTELRYVEPEGAASLKRAVEEGMPVTLPQIDGFVDGAAVARIGDATFANLSRVFPAQILTPPEERICGSMVEMLNVEGIVLEPAGALAIDVLQDLREEIAGKTVVCVASGGNFDFERLPDVKERALRFRGLKKYYVLRMPQRTGALKDFLGLLGPNDDIFRFEYLKKSARNFGSVLIGIDSDAPENFPRLCERMAATGIAYQDITDNADLMGLIV